MLGAKGNLFYATLRLSKYERIPFAPYIILFSFSSDPEYAVFSPSMKVVSGNIFVKTKANALTSGDLSGFIEKNGINEFFVAGADATGCVKSTCYNMTKAGYSVYVISDCVTSYDLKKLDEMYAYYAGKGCEVKELEDYMEA